MSSKKKNQRRTKSQKRIDSLSRDEANSLKSEDMKLDLDLTEDTLSNTELDLDLDLVNRSRADFQEAAPEIAFNPNLNSIVKGTDITLRLGDSDFNKIPDSGDLGVLDSREKRIIHPDMDDVSLLNSFRGIRTHLIQNSPKKNFVLIVVSIAPNMGATFFTVNIGAAFSYEGQKTSLLIECNQREPKFNRIFDVEMKDGLTDYLHDTNIGAKNIIYSTGINRMNFIPIGHRKNVGEEILSSERMQEFIGVLKRRYTDRYIILDAPPLEVSSDAAILSEIADYIVIIASYGKVTSSRINKAIKLLPKEKIAGIIINKKKNQVLY